MLISTSCFTGIESTKKITMSKEEKRLVEPTPEEKFLVDIVGQRVDQWDAGKKFVVSDERASIVLTPLADAKPVAEIVGDTISFISSSVATGFDGNEELRLLFGKGSDRYEYAARHAGNTGVAEITSDRMPMLIDLEMVDEVWRRLKSGRYYLLSPNWLDERGERLQGEKFVEVEILSLEPGSMVYPMKAKFRTVNDGRIGVYMMNFENGDRGARGFSALFSLTDPHKRYAKISDETWSLIQNGRVVPGMTKEECRLSLGAPEDVNSGRDYSRTLDLWQYADGTVLFFEEGLLTRSRIAGEGPK